MVPVLEPSGLPGRRTANGYLQKGFPIWTRGDDSDDESADSESLEAHRPRARRQDASASNFKDKKAVEPTGYYLAKKGLLKDLAEPVISGFLSAIKGGKDSSPSSGDEDDSDNNKEDNKDKPKDLSDIPPQPPPVTEPPAPLPSAEPAVKPPPSQPLFSFPAVASPEPKTSQSEKGSPDQPAPVPMSSSAAQVSCVFTISYDCILQQLKWLICILAEAVYSGGADTASKSEHDCWRQHRAAGI